MKLTGTAILDVRSFRVHTVHAECVGPAIQESGPYSSNLIVHGPIGTDPGELCARTACSRPLDNPGA